MRRSLFLKSSRASEAASHQLQPRYVVHIAWSFCVGGTQIPFRMCASGCRPRIGTPFGGRYGHSYRLAVDRDWRGGRKCHRLVPVGRLWGGGSFHSTQAGGIWRNLMPGNLAKFLPFLDEATRAELFGSIFLAAKYPLGDPIRTGVIQGGQEFSRFFTHHFTYRDPRAQPTARR